MIIQTKKCPVCDEPPEQLIISKAEYECWLGLANQIGLVITPSRALAKAFPNMGQASRRRIWDGICWQCAT